LPAAIYHYGAVALGGMLGATARYYLSELFAQSPYGHSFPIATLCINLLGCLLIGVFMEYCALLAPDNLVLKLFLTTGLLGGFTTFSAFGAEAVMLFQTGALMSAWLYVVISLLGGCTAVLVGTSIARLFF
jgi:CrcB protein